MASKVIVKMPVTTFGQVNKSKSTSVNGDMVVTRPQEMTQTPRSPAKDPTTPKTQEQSRISQLEQNLKFLQEQHQLMLTGLHNEIESLKVRNRELQFQLVFAKGSTPVSSPSSSSEDDLKHKVYSSPKAANLTPLQIEILERDLGELRLQLQDTENRNAHLNSLIEEQKMKLEKYEREKDTQCDRLKSAAVEKDDSELERRLEEAETLIRRLRRENSDLRRENAVRFAVSKGGGGENGYGATSPRSSGGGFGVNNSRGGNGGGRHKGNGHYRDDWFPPLNYWHNGRRGGGSNSGGGGGRGKRHSVPSPDSSHPVVPEDSINNTLPELKQHNHHQQHPPPQSGSHQQFQRHGGRRNHNNNHYQDGVGGGGGGRKYHHRSNQQQHKNPQT